VITREPEYFPPSKNSLGSVGRGTLFWCRAIGQAVMLLAMTVLSLRYVFTKRSRREVLGQMFVCGVKSLGVVTIVAVFTGMILALHAGIAVRDFNQEPLIGAAVLKSMLMDMGPFMTGLILAACVGSAIAAQIGTMVVSEEIAALEIMSIDPLRFLVMPRLVAMSIMTPVLSFYTAIAGLIGGGVICNVLLGVSWGVYLDNAIELGGENKDLYVGLLKAFIFGIVITTVSCHEGFATKQGAVGVGEATRRSVIISFLLILMFGLLITGLFYF
jgi:phospholipid/cholesterol/gamma-HCH transport system permease protein